MKQWSVFLYAYTALPLREGEIADMMPNDR